MNENVQQNEEEANAPITHETALQYAYGLLRYLEEHVPQLAEKFILRKIRFRIKVFFKTFSRSE